MHVNFIFSQLTNKKTTVCDITAPSTGHHYVPHVYTSGYGGYGGGGYGGGHYHKRSLRGMEPEEEEDIEVISSDVSQ